MSQSQSEGFSQSTQHSTEYILLTDKASYYPNIMEEPIIRPGLYSWVRAFEGTLGRWEDYCQNPKELNQFDIVHINLTLNDFGLARKVKKFLDYDTRLVVNLDYSVEYLNEMIMNTGGTLQSLTEDLRSADMVFAVEPYQAWYLDHLKRNDTGVEVIPHPIDSEEITKLAVSFEERDDCIAYHWHKYEKSWAISKSILDTLLFPIVFLGWMPTDDYSLGVQNLRSIYNWEPDLKNTDFLVPLTNWRSYIRTLSRCSLAHEYRLHHVASRFILECAALGIPVVTSDNSYLTREIWSELSFEDYQFFAITQKLSDIIHDSALRRRLSEQGMKNVTKFNLENSKNRFLESL